MRSLRIAHIADTHLGYRSSSLFGRDEDFMASWMYACRAIVDSSPDIILHAGDVFHSARPDWKALTGFHAGIRILQESKAPIFIIAGNHDTSSINLNHTVFTFAAQIFEGIEVTNGEYPSLHCIDNLGVDVVLVPHRALLDKNLVSRVLDLTCAMDGSRPAILVCHGSISKEDNISEPGSLAIPHGITEYPWDYIALGHLHVQQPYGQRGWYSGSIERCGWSDYSGSPAWTLTTLGADRSLTHTQQPLPHMPMIQLPEYTCEDLSDDFICAGILESCTQVRIPLERVHIRIKLTKLPPWRKRKIESFVEKRLRRDFPKTVFSAVVDSEVALMGDVDHSSARDVMKGITEHFKDFIGEQDYQDKEFGKSFLDRGLELLVQDDE